MSKAAQAVARAVASPTNGPKPPSRSEPANPAAASVTQKVRIVDVTVGQRMRPARHVESLMESINVMGLLEPILVNNDLHLIAGLRRLTACTKLGHEFILAHIRDLNPLELELAEIDENLRREELTILEQCEQVVRRRAILRELDQLASIGRPEKGVTVTPFQTVQSFAEAMDCSESSVERRIFIGERLAPDVCDVLRETAIADRLTDLRVLAAMPPAEQRRAAVMIAAGEAKGVNDAKSQIEGPPATDDQPYTVGTDTPERNLFARFDIKGEYMRPSARMRLRPDDELKPREQKWETWPGVERLGVPWSVLKAEDPHDAICEEIANQLYRALKAQPIVIPGQATAVPPSDLAEDDPDEFAVEDVEPTEAELSRVVPHG